MNISVFRLRFIIALCFIFIGTSVALGQTNIPDTTAMKDKELEKLEKKAEKKYKKELLKDKAKDAGDDIKEDIKQTGEDLKEKGKEIWTDVKENAIELKEEVSDLFDTHIKSNVVGAFTDDRREANQKFCLYLLKPLKPFSVTYYTPSYEPSSKKTFSTKDSDSVYPNTPSDYIVKPSDVISFTPIDKPSEPFKNDGDLIQTNPIAIKLYGINIKLDIEPRLSSYGIGKLTEKNISSFWQKLSESRFDIPLKQLYDASVKYNLNDWALYQLIRSAAVQIFPKNKGGEQEYWTVFMLNQAGYAAKLGRMDISEKEQKLIVLLPIHETLYNTPAIVIDSVHFYFFEKLNKKQRNVKVHTYRGLFSMATYPMSSQFNNTINLPHLYERNGLFTYDLQLTEFYKDYPFCHTSVYKNTKYSSILSKSIEANIRPIMDSIKLASKKGEETVNSLLYLSNFVANYLKPEPKAKIHSINQALFVEEALAYKCGDDRDKAIVLSFLVSHFLELPSILAEYENAALLGVRINLQDQKDKYNIVVDGEKYFLLNPSASDTNPWTIPPSLKGINPIVIK